MTAEIWGAQPYLSRPEKDATVTIRANKCSDNTAVSLWQQPKKNNLDMSIVFCMTGPLDTMMFHPKWEFVLEMSKIFRISKKILENFCKHLKAAISVSAFGMHTSHIQMRSVAVLPLLPLTCWLKSAYINMSLVVKTLIYTNYIL